MQVPEFTDGPTTVWHSYSEAKLWRQEDLGLQPGSVLDSPLQALVPSAVKWVIIK